jgi:protoporphyrinogen IX oxidase
VDFYLLTKAVHIIAVISWMAGMLYLPRLFVYHVQLRDNNDAVETFKVMERRLLTAIMTPAFVVAFLSGLLLLFYFGNVDWGSFWLWCKLLSLFIMIYVHVFLGQCQRAFVSDSNRHSEKFFRIINEVPAVLMIVIVVMIVMRPF